MAWNRDHRGGRDRSRRDDFSDGGFDSRGGGFDSRNSGFDSRGGMSRSFERERPSLDRQQVVTKENITATVKWFNASKGFGFVAPSDGTPDAFLHISSLERTGLTQVAEGATVVCDLGQGQRGPQVITVHSVDESTAQAAPRAPRPDRFATQGPVSDPTDGVVKFFSPDKGFGFIQLDNGGKDVFVHVRALERAGVSVLENGQRVRITVSQGLKGPQAETIELI